MQFVLEGELCADSENQTLERWSSWPHVARISGWERISLLQPGDRRRNRPARSLSALCREGRREQDRLRKSIRSASDRIMRSRDLAFAMEDDCRHRIPASAQLLHICVIFRCYLAAHRPRHGAVNQVRSPCSYRSRRHFKIPKSEK